MHAAQAGLAQRAALDDAQARAEARERAADVRDRVADEPMKSQTRKTEQRLPGHATALLQALKRCGSSSSRR